MVRLFAIFPLLFLFGVAVAQEASVEEVLEGFDEPSSTAAADESGLDEVLQGFDEGGADTGESGELDTVLEGFEVAPASATEVVGSADAASAWKLSGAMQLSLATNVDHHAPSSGTPDQHGLSRLRATVDLALEGEPVEAWKLKVEGYARHDLAYDINGRGDYTGVLLDEMETEVELGEAFLRGSPADGVDLTVGRQIVVWGTSDNLRVTDVLNPLDLREFGMVDIEDLRLPLAGARLDLYRGDWSFSLLAIPEIRFNKAPAWGSDFYPYTAPPPREAIPVDGLDNAEYALTARGIFSGWDLALYAADIYDDGPHLVAGEARHARITMVGAAFSAAVENWLLKGEAAHFEGVRHTTIPGGKRARTELLLGAEYSGFRDTTLAIEVADRHLHDYDRRLMLEGIERDEWQLALRYRRELMHSRLALTALGLWAGDSDDDGGLVRLTAEYELADALKLTAGGIFYIAGEQSPFDAIAGNDRLFLELKYSF